LFRKGWGEFFLYLFVACELEWSVQHSEGSLDLMFSQELLNTLDVPDIRLFVRHLLSPLDFVRRCLKVCR
jgi:hypothetical protein